MSSDFSYKNIIRKEFFFLFFLYLTLLLSFILGENSTGGVKIDFPVNKQLIFDFSENLIGTLLSYNEYDHRHSPVFLILLSLLKKAGLNIDLIRIVNVCKNCNLPVTHPYFENHLLLWNALLDTTKHRNGKQNLPVPTDIGKSTFLNDVTLDDVKNTVEIFKEMTL